MLQRMKRFLILLLATVAIGIVACDKSGQNQPQVSTLHRGLSSDPESIDPHKARSTQAAEVQRDIGEGLVGYSPTGSLVGGAAESWEVSEDGLTYIFKIRDAARWSNGDPLTAEHFVFSFRRLVDPATAAFYGQALAAIVNADAIIRGDMPPDELGVVAADDHRLVISLQQPTPYLLGLLTHPSTFPVHPESIASHGAEFTRPGNLLSNGAYKLESWDTSSVLRLVRNEHYWNNAATAIDAVNFHILTQEMTQLNRFRAGEIDITDSIPPDSFASLREQYAEQIHIAPSLGVHYYGFNLTKPPFANNRALRQALSMAIDRETLVDKVIGRGETPAYSWVPPGVDDYDPIRFTFAEQSQEERNAAARRLYREAGYSDAQPLEIELRYNTSDTQQRIALAIQAMWAEVLGIRTTLVNEEFQVMLANIRAAEVTQVFRSSWIGDYNDAHTFLNILQSGNPSNSPRFENARFDKLMRDAEEQIEARGRRLFLEEAERVLLSEHPVIPLYFSVSKHLVSTRVQGWGDNVLDYHYSQHLSFTTD
jgi:oligopeptide transport system substrate-binding protein